MSILDRFFKGKKEITRIVNDQLEKDENAVKAASEKESLIKAAEGIRNKAKQYLPGDVSSLYTQRKMLKSLITCFNLSDDLYDETEKLFAKTASGELALLQCSATIANNVNKALEGSDTENAEKALCEGEEAELLKAWVVLDYYVSILKPEFGDSLKLLRDRMSKAILQRGLDKESMTLQNEIYALEKQCAELQKTADKENELEEKRKELIKLVLEKECFFVLYDNEFNAAFPFVALDGRMEICTRYETAAALKRHYESENMGNITVKRLEKTELEKMLRAMAHMGISLVRLDNGISPCDISSLKTVDCTEKNLVERFNRSMRGMFLRTMQYSRRLNRAGAKIKGTPKEKAMLEALLTARFNGYREFGNSICYVFANQPYKKGVTLYSEKALKRAKELCKIVKLDESSLVSPLDTCTAPYEGGMNLRVTRKSESDTMESSFLCVFTSRFEAEKARVHFEKFGCNDSVVAVTYDEIAGQVTSCAGILLDMSSYAFEIKKKELEEIKKWRGVKGKIAINVKRKEETENNGGEKEIKEK